MNFLTGKELNEKIYDTIYNSEKYLLILSPFIQLDPYFKNEVFKTHLNNANVHIIIGFGKNENNVNKSLRKEDFEYFTQFPNITIVYIPKLHAKYYGNENRSVITSMNLIDYSFINNIEFGVYSQRKLMSINQNSFFESAINTCFNVVEQEGYTIYVKRPKYEKKPLFGKNYVGSEVELNKIDELIKFGKVTKICLSDFTNEKYVNVALKDQRKSREEYHVKNDNKTDKSTPHIGYCIRCRTTIKVDLGKPLCLDCYKTWSLYQDPFYRENFCISCGEKNNTSFNRPACSQCYKELQSK
ncbi:PLD-like domain-containing protein [Chryseobacterium piscicola]|uniref:PLD-like domain-containing protein n=1 Tax=Chryseobacterium piscicola TaxID=551459 RepID=A0A1N7KSH9_9FLAO|nr:phospholipase D-like domain-containing protein [Chryseobacterium piscicola]PQA94990.1 hypothetical protein B0A70_06625 [Chryseobacterium piscicola]SIS64573.1 PLD-like domain-containing protein [Chryseobacterium piscicola]